MSAAVLPHRVSVRRSPGVAVIRLAVRQVRRGALIVAATCAAMSFLVAAQYQSTFRGELSQDALRALSENPAIRILFGAPTALDDPGGFTVWRTGTPLLVLAGVWIMLAAVRITRGEEEAGRWNLLLAGPLRAADVLRGCLLVLAGSALLIGFGVGVGMLAAGTDADGASCYAVAFLGVTLTFAALGSLAAQIMPTRSSAVGLAAAVLGTALLTRMLADGFASVSWLAWLSPFGLVARVAPYAENRVTPLVVLLCYSVVLCAAAPAVARVRDLGGGLLHVPPDRSPRLTLLRSVGGFAARRAIRTTVGWMVGVGAYFGVVGATLGSILDFFAQNPRFADLAAAAGFAGLNSPEGFAAALFSLLAIPTGLYAATRCAGFVTDEREGRWTGVLASSVPRRRLLWTELAAVGSGVVILHVTAAVGLWGGAAVTGAALGFADAVAGAANTIPIAGLSLGAAVIAVGWLPSAVTAVGAAPVVGGFLVNVVADSMMVPAWIVTLSPFVHVAAVPSAPPNWCAAGALLALGVALTACGSVGYQLRDLVC